MRSTEAPSGRISSLAIRLEPFVKTVALIAHDRRKDVIVDFALRHRARLAQCSLLGTGTTAQRIREATGLPVLGLSSGPLGGDLQIGGWVAEGRVQLVVFLRDPLTAQPHEPDIAALMRVCDVHDVPLATNLSSAEALIKTLCPETEGL